MKNGEKYLNRSRSLTKLFWFRIWYDAIFFLLVVFLYRYYRVSRGIISECKSVYELTAIIFPVAIKESLVYFICVVRAQDRAAYQKHSKWRKGGECPFQMEKSRDEYYYKKGHEHEIRLKRVKNKAIRETEDKFF